VASLSCPSDSVGDVVLRSTWFTQDDVNVLKGAGINTVRIPVCTFTPLSVVGLSLFQLGYWIVEPLVNRTTESYPCGGIRFLVGLVRVEVLKNSLGAHQSSGLKMLRDADIRVILDHHALPGVQTPNQVFAGQYVFHCIFQYPLYN
jgi:glucan endo-1,6-beta-glucosidase